MTPYYDDGKGIAIYHGDCRDVLSGLPPLDVMLTDPPWISSGSRLPRREDGGVAKVYRESRGIGVNDLGGFDPEAIRLASQLTRWDQFVICGFKELGAVCRLAEPVRGVFVWHKPNAPPTRGYPTAMDTAVIVWSGAKTHLCKWASHPYTSTVFTFNVQPAGCFASERILGEGKKAAHPAQGPLGLYLSILRPIPSDAIVADPFMGTGTTLVAAKGLGMKAIGIEIEEMARELRARAARGE